MKVTFGLNGYVPLNRVWFSGPQLRLKQGIEQPAFLGRKPLESVKVWDEWSTFAVISIFYSKTFNSMIIVWKIALFCMQNETNQSH